MKKLRIIIDYEIEDGVFEFTRDYLLRRGFCCNKHCKHCPFVESVGAKESK